MQEINKENSIKNPVVNTLKVYNDIKDKKIQNTASKILNYIKDSRTFNIDKANKKAIELLHIKENLKQSDITEYQQKKYIEKTQNYSTIRSLHEGYKAGGNFLGNIPYIGDIIDATQDLKINKINAKAYRGEQLTDNELALFDKQIAELKKQNIFNDNFSFKFGMGFFPNIKYGIEFGLNSALASSIAGPAGIALTPLIQSASPSSLFRKYQAGQLAGDLVLTEKGEIFFGNLQKNPLKTLYKVYTENLAETLAEKYGGIMLGGVLNNKLTKYISNNLTGINKNVFDLLIGTAEKTGKLNKWTKGFSELFDGLIEENFEEYIENPLKQLLGSTDKEYNIENLIKSFEIPSIDDFLLTNSMILIQGGVGRTQNYLYNKLINNGVSIKEVEQFIKTRMPTQQEQDAKQLKFIETQQQEKEWSNIKSNYKQKLIDRGFTEDYASDALNITENLYVNMALNFDTTPKARIDIFNKYGFDLQNIKLDKGIKGQYDPINKIISLSEIKDKTTFLHEIVHWYRDVVGQFVNEGSKQAQQELNTMNNYVGATDGNWTIKQQEKLSRSFEQYLRRGIAPTKDLKCTFERLRDWLIQIYKSSDDIKNIDGKSVLLNNEIIDLYDKILTGTSKYIETQQNNLQKEIENKRQELLNQGLIPEEVYKIVEDKYMERLKQIEEQISRSNILSEEDMKAYINDYKKYNKNPMKGRLNSFGRTIIDYSSNALISENQNIREISENIYQKLVLNNFDKIMQKKDIEDKTYKFINNLFDIRKKDADTYLKFSIAWYNNDMQTLADLSSKQGIYEEFLKLRETLEDLYDKQLEVGIELPHKENYLPTKIKSGNFEKLMELIQQKIGKDIYNEINKKIAEQGLVGETALAFVNNYLRGFVPDSILLSPTNFTKRRTLERSSEFFPYYEDILQTYISYINATINNINDRRLFGKGTAEQQTEITLLKRKEKQLKILEKTPAGKIKTNEIYKLEFEKKANELKFENYNNLIKNKKETLTLKDGTILNLKDEADKINNKINNINRRIDFVKNISSFAVLNTRKKEVNIEINTLRQKIKENYNLENSIAKFVMQETDLSYTKQKRLTELLKSIFNKKETPLVLQKLDTFSGIYNLTSFKSAFKQLSEIANSFYKNGINNTIAGIFNKEIDLNDIGLDGRWNNKTESYLQNLYSSSLKYTGFDKFDTICKNSFINGNYIKTKNLLNNNDINTIKKIELIFNEKAQQIIEDFKNGNRTYDVLSYLFSNLNDVQPLTDGAKTKVFNDNPGLRFAYSLKSYVIQQLSMVKNDIYNEFKNGNKKQALKNVIKLQLSLWLGGVPISMIGNWLFGDEDEEYLISDALMDNIILNNIINRFNLGLMAGGKFVDFLVGMTSPTFIRPTKNLVSDLFGILTGDFKNKFIGGSAAIRNLPNFNKDGN